LPAFKRPRHHKRALEAGAKVHGAQSILWSPKWIQVRSSHKAQSAVQPGDSEEALAMRVLKVEHRIYPWPSASWPKAALRVVDGICLIDGVPCP